MIPDAIHDAAALGLYFDKLPPAQPTLADLARRAIATEAALSLKAASAIGCNSEEWNRLEADAFDARAELRAALMNLGLTKPIIDRLGDVL